MNWKCGWGIVLGVLVLVGAAVSAPGQTKISELPAFNGTASGNETFPAVSAGATVKMALADVAGYLQDRTWTQFTLNGSWDIGSSSIIYGTPGSFDNPSGWRLALELESSATGNATGLTSGTLDDARLSSNFTTPTSWTLYNGTANFTMRPDAQGNLVLTRNGTALGNISTGGSIYLTGNTSVNSGGADIYFPAGEQAYYGIWWGDPANGSGLYNKAVSHEQVVTSKKRVAIVSSADFMGDGFIQLGNNGGTGEQVFISQEGAASANQTAVGSHRLYLNTSYFNGTASVDDRVMIEGHNDGSGGGIINLYADPTQHSVAYNATLNKWVPSTQTPTVSIASAGLTIRNGTANATLSSQSSENFILSTNGTQRMVVSGNAILANGSNTVPAFGSITNPTSGIGFTGSDPQLIRSGTTLLYTQSGEIVVQAKLTALGDLDFRSTLTTAGTTGNVTIDRSMGSANFAAGATSLVVTNNLVTTSSFIFVSVASNDANMKSASAVAGTGNFTIYADAAPAAETRVNFLVIQ